ncbi:hypothetical protein RM53_14250 [Brevundimonas nasdae]|uniref:Uncharacterized protein n=1 Tax=Brevundimonas nasdae TaxID=172043 RepID=A0A0B4C4B9_9CAUL|nr:hypothetical protein RM53_14250 [Brevundimonas nasdae]
MQLFVAHAVLAVAFERPVAVGERLIQVRRRVGQALRLIHQVVDGGEVARDVPEHLIRQGKPVLKRLLILLELGAQLLRLPQ